MFARILCLLAGHRINRRRVRHDGLDFRSHCRRCGRDMVRERHGWVPANGDGGTQPQPDA